MPTTFSYTALNQKGKSVSGSIPADTRAAAIAAIISKGLSPIKIAEAGKGGAKGAAPAPAMVDGKPVKKASGGGFFGNRVSQRVIEDFTRELASLLAGGVPLSRALTLLMR